MFLLAFVCPWGSYLIMALMNLLGERLGSPGRRFIFEMDEVMGGLLGIPHYSKLEFVLLMFTSLGFWLTWVLQPEAVLVSVLGILTGTVYMLVCVFYAVYARQNRVAFLIPFLVNLALLIWRSVRYDKLAGQLTSPGQVPVQSPGPKKGKRNLASGLVTKIS